MEIVWYGLGTQGFEGGFEGIGAFGPEGIPLLLLATQNMDRRKLDRVRAANLGLFMQLCALLFDTLSNNGGELCGSKYSDVSKVSEKTHFDPRTLSCSNTALDSHFTLASRVRTSTALRADDDESWLARKHSCSPCCNAFLDCNTKETMWGSSCPSRCADI